MFLNLLLGIIAILSIGWFIAHLADMHEQKHFRESLIPGMDVLIELKIDDKEPVKAIAKVTKIFYDEDNPTCNLILIVDEKDYELIDWPVNSVYKP